MKIEEAGGYDVGVLAASDGLLVADDGSVPIPVDERVWGAGKQDPHLMDLSVELIGIVGAYPDNLVGGAFSANDVFLEVYAKDPEGAGIADIAALVEERGMVGKVVIVPVTYSMSDLEEAKDAIASQFGDDLSLNVDMVENKVVAIPVTPELEAELLTETDTEQVSVSELVDTSTVSLLDPDIGEVQVMIETPTVTTAASGRNDDYSPYYMGGKIKRSSGTTSYCSMGVPIVLKNTFMVLTAGHCCVLSSWFRPCCCWFSCCYVVRSLGRG